MIQKQYLSDGAIGRFRKALEKRLETEPRQDGEVDVNPIRKRIEDLDRQIDQGAERIFSAPEGLVPKSYTKLDQLRAERDELQRRLDVAERQQNGPATDRAAWEAEREGRIRREKARFSESASWIRLRSSPTASGRLRRIGPPSMSADRNLLRQASARDPRLWLTTAA